MTQFNSPRVPLRPPLNFSTPQYRAPAGWNARATAPLLSVPRPKRPDAVQHIGKYRVIKTIGKGNFAIVKLAKHEPTGRMVAIKIIDKNQLSSASLHKMHREVRIMKRLDHPNIVKLYEVLETTDTLYLVMEYASGGEIFEYLISNGRMRESDAKTKFRQIVSAIHYCHMKSIVHRDLKAENLLLDRDMNIKIADFGFSNEFTADGKLSTFCGSPPYAAPELFQGKKYTGPEVDIWSIGVILFTMMTGSLPFDGRTLKELKERVLKGKFRVPFYMPSDCERLIKKCLVLNPLKRISLEAVMKDNWVNAVSSGETLRPYVESIQELDEERINFMVQNMGFSYEDINKSLNNQRYNESWATYHLLGIKMPRDGTAVENRPVRRTASELPSGPTAKQAGARPPLGNAHLGGMFGMEVTLNNIPDDEEPEAEEQQSQPVLPKPDNRCRTLPTVDSDCSYIGNDSMEPAPLSPRQAMSLEDTLSPSRAYRYRHETEITASSHEGSPRTPRTPRTLFPFTIRQPHKETEIAATSSPDDSLRMPLVVQKPRETEIGDSSRDSSPEVSPRTKLQQNSPKPASQNSSPRSPNSAALVPLAYSPSSTRRVRPNLKVPVKPAEPSLENPLDVPPACTSTPLRIPHISPFTDSEPTATHDDPVRPASLTSLTDEVSCQSDDNLPLLSFSPARKPVVPGRSASFAVNRAPLTNLRRAPMFRPLITELTEEPHPNRQAAAVSVVQEQDEQEESVSVPAEEIVVQQVISNDVAYHLPELPVIEPPAPVCDAQPAMCSTPECAIPEPAVSDAEEPEIPTTELTDVEEIAPTGNVIGVRVAPPKLVFDNDGLPAVQCAPYSSSEMPERGWTFPRTPCTPVTSIVGVAETAPPWNVYTIAPPDSMFVRNIATRRTVTGVSTVHSAVHDQHSASSAAHRPAGACCVEANVTQEPLVNSSSLPDVMADTSPSSEHIVPPDSSSPGKKPKVRHRSFFGRLVARLGGKR